MNIKKVMVVGAGQMGGGIAQVMAQAGIPTCLYDLDKNALDRGLALINKNLARSVEKGRMTETEKASVTGLLTPSFAMSDASGCDLMVEAIVENKEIKTKVFAELDRICPEHAILASNTSSVPITEIAAATKRPEKIIGMHFMNPVPVMKLVEIIRGIATDDATMQAIADLTLKLNKTPVIVRDVPGFVSNRVLQMLISEAIWCLYEGVSTAEGIDNVMKLGMNHAMGPLATADLIGLDTVLSIQQVMYEGYGNPKYSPCPLLKQYVYAGWLGKKSGRGFYAYR
jgi:3-hydroxybutyryl-CoA dehydrogenase